MIYCTLKKQIKYLLQNGTNFIDSNIGHNTDEHYFLLFSYNNMQYDRYMFYFLFLSISKDNY